MSISPELRDRAATWLSQTLATDHRPVTFRELAREVHCHVHVAKNLLRDYLASHPEVDATYLVSGPLHAHSSLSHTALTQDDAPAATQSLAHLSATQKVRIANLDEQSDDERNSEAGDDEEEEKERLEEGAREIEVEAEPRQKGRSDEVVARWGVVLVGGEELDEKRSLFDEASVHVYALAPAPVKDPAAFLSSAFGLRERKDYIQQSLGTLVGESLMAQSNKPAASSSSKATAKEAAKKEVKEVKKEVAKNEPFSSFKKEVTEAKPKESSQKHKPKAASKTKRRVIESDEEEEEPIEAPTPSKGKTSLKQTSSMVRAEDQAAMEAMMAMDVDLDDDDDGIEISGESTPQPTAKPKSTSKSGQKRKRRVKKSRTEKDAKGYMVTKDYWTDESYSGSETDTESNVPAKVAPSKPKSASASTREPTRTNSNAPDSKAGSSRPASGKAPIKKAPMGQSTLAGFFKKK